MNQKNENNNQSFQHAVEMFIFRFRLNFCTFETC